MIFDIILIAIFVGFIVTCARRGAVRSLSNVITSIVSYFGAIIVGKLIAYHVYQIFIKPAVENAVNQSLENVTASAAGDVVNSLPSWLVSLVGLTSEDLLNLVQGPLDSANGAIMKAVFQAVYPIAMGLLVFFITILLFFFFLWLCRKFLVGPLDKIFRFPLLNIANRVLGAVIGLIEALLLVCMLAYLAKLVVADVGASTTWLNKEAINDSYLFSRFYQLNLFSWVGSLVGQ